MCVGDFMMLICVLVIRDNFYCGVCCIMFVVGASRYPIRPYFVFNGGYRVEM